MSILTDIITYFAQFPDREGVLRNFSSTKELVPGYGSLKQTIEALPAPLIPDLKEYVFSTNELVLANILKNMKGFFLLLEYGAIDGSPKGNYQTRDFGFNLAITVGHNYNQHNTDSMAESLLMDQCLNYLIDIKKQMAQDNFDLCGNDDFMEGSLNLTPVEPALMYNNLGWTLSFKKNENID